MSTTNTNETIGPIDASLYRDATYTIGPNGALTFESKSPAKGGGRLYVGKTGQVKGYYDSTMGTVANDRLTAFNTQDRSKVLCFMGIDQPGSFNKNSDGLSAYEQIKPSPWSLGIHTARLALASVRPGTIADGQTWIFGNGSDPSRSSSAITAATAVDGKSENLSPTMPASTISSSSVRPEPQ